MFCTYCLVGVYILLFFIYIFYSVTYTLFSLYSFSFDWNVKWENLLLTSFIFFKICFCLLSLFTRIFFYVFDSFFFFLFGNPWIRNACWLIPSRAWIALIQFEEGFKEKPSSNPIYVSSLINHFIANSNWRSFGSHKSIRIEQHWCFLFNDNNIFKRHLMKILYYYFILRFFPFFKQLVIAHVPLLSFIYWGKCMLTERSGAQEEKWEWKSSPIGNFVDAFVCD